MAKLTEDVLSNRFTGHKVRSDGLRDMETVRQSAYNAAVVINELAPEGREKALAFTKLEEAVFWANAAIARENTASQRYLPQVTP